MADPDRSNADRKSCRTGGNATLPQDEVERFVDGMKEKLEEATVKLDRLKAKHAKRDDELGEVTAHASRLL